MTRSTSSQVWNLFMENFLAKTICILCTMKYFSFLGTLRIFILTLWNISKLIEFIDATFFTVFRATTTTTEHFGHSDQNAFPATQATIRSDMCNVQRTQILIPLNTYIRIRYFGITKNNCSDKLFQLDSEGCIETFREYFENLLPKDLNMIMHKRDAYFYLPLSFLCVSSLKGLYFIYLS